MLAHLEPQFWSQAGRREAVFAIEWA